MKESLLEYAPAVCTISNVSKIEQNLCQIFREESICVDTSPRCGDCKCENCSVLNKTMSLKNERLYELFRNNMVYDEKGTQNDPGPYWRSKLPFLVDRHILPDNKKQVLAVMKSTSRRLDRKDGWRSVYENQLNELIRKGYAREVLDSEISKFVNPGGKIYYIAHQVVEDSQNKTTPVRVVFNSSQNCGGTSLNKSLEVGPEVMQDLPGILLRFREDHVAAMGDIKKMFYGIRVTKEDQFMQLWCWQFSGEEDIKTFMMTRLVMGNGPSTAISIISVKETANLFDFSVKYPHAKEALCRNSYVDNVNVGADNLNELDKRIAEVEFVASKGGHIFKPWVRSGDTDVSELVISPLPESLVDLTERNLGIYWNVT